MARRGDKGLGNTANGGTAGSYTTIERKENATALQSMRSRITSTFTGSTRYPAYENGEISEELDIDDREPVELAKQVRGSIGCSTERIIGM